MNNRRRRAKAPEAIVVVNALGTAVDCNNAFAQLCQTPAGMLVGQRLSGFAPELAAVLEDATQIHDDNVMTFANQNFALAIQPFETGINNSASQETADRVIRLRGLSWDEVA